MSRKRQRTATVGGSILPWPDWPSDIVPLELVPNDQLSESDRVTKDDAGTVPGEFVWSPSAKTVSYSPEYWSMLSGMHIPEDPALQDAANNLATNTAALRQAQAGNGSNQTQTQTGNGSQTPVGSAGNSGGTDPSTSLPAANASNPVPATTMSAAQDGGANWLWLLLLLGLILMSKDKQ